MEGLSKRVRRVFLRWLSHRLPACDEVTRLVSEGMDRDLRFGERTKMRLHLTMCRWCARYFRQVHLIREEAHALADRVEALPPSEALSEEARRRIHDLLTG